METTTRIGAQSQNGDVVSCLVCVSPGLQGLGDLVRSFSFEDVGLAPFMAQHRAAIENGEPAALAAAHLAFGPIVERLLRDGTLNVELGDTWHVARYAEPTVRGGKKTYAEYLHNDAWYDDDAPLAMVNVWLILNDSDAPPRNQLVFTAVDADEAIPSPSEHMLHAGVSTDEVACEAMSWGRFYVFVSGQRKTARHVLLHGAADVPWIEDSGEDRRSCELRYTIQATPEAAAAPGAEEEKDDDAGLGGLFDDSSDSEPGSPDLMSAAWVEVTVERMASNPVLQRMARKPDLASVLARMDLSQRQKLRSNIARREEYQARADAMRAEVAEAERRRDAAVAELERHRVAAEAQRAEVNRQIAEQHANDQFPAGG